MWNWIKQKLGIKDYTKELLELNIKVNESIKLSNLCISKLEELEVMLTSIEASQSNLYKSLGKIKTQIEAIPKEMIIKNVLSI